MLNSTDVAATIAVKDIDRARKFYEDTLGLDVTDDSMGEVITFKAGGSNLLVYKSEFAGTNKATAATFGLGDEIDSVVRELGKKGVAFEHYRDMPDTSLDGDIHVSGSMRVAWFKDPDGNILCLVKA